MALIKSISGIRGTIGGTAGDNLTPQDIVASTAGFATMLLKKYKSPTVVIGRDARISGALVNQLVCGTLQMMGINVVDLGLSTTPTVEIAVVKEGAHAGIILTASHNPKQWNALKLLNKKGEFISAKDGQTILDIIERGEITYAAVDKLGTYRQDDTYINQHIADVLAMPLVNVEHVRSKGFKVVVDCINSTGALAIPPLLEQLGCEVILLNEEITGDFAHNPEPLPAHLRALSQAVTTSRAHLGISVDPDVDRLAFVCEDGEMFGEEYTLVAVADYILKHRGGDTVSNLSSTRALRDVTEKHGGTYHASAVGEVNVVTKMKEVNAVIGGEGNGGIIYPDAHYGRDAIVGIALFLSHLADFGKPVSFLRSTYPQYTISKNKIQLTPDIDIDYLLARLKDKYKMYELNTIDGLKIEIDKDWIHLRRSNTEPIIRIYSESNSKTVADNLARKIQQDVHEILKGAQV
ncbi:MAG: phosphoglucosamine mutase [Bacteroidota bacterium]